MGMADSNREMARYSFNCFRKRITVAMRTDMFTRTRLISTRWRMKIRRKERERVRGCMILLAALAIKSLLILMSSPQKEYEDIVLYLADPSHGQELDSSAIHDTLYWRPIDFDATQADAGGAKRHD